MEPRANSVSMSLDPQAAPFALIGHDDQLGIVLRSPLCRGVGVGRHHVLGTDGAAAENCAAERHLPQWPAQVKRTKQHE
jgi:hypothetical protein